MAAGATQARRGPRFGVWFEGDTAHARVWAAGRQRVEVVLDGTDGERRVALAPDANGCFHAVLPGARAGDHYRVSPDGEGPFPDPASRWQPDGVHGRSRIVDPRAFHWTDSMWKGPDPARLVTYELHIGSFSPEGTFDGARRRLEYLAQLGVTAIELMPVADFPGRWNWGYDGVSLYAPSRAYGTPDELRALVDAAHGVGLAVLLDVVYNHLGPDGAYLPAISRAVFTPRHRTPWGDALNFDGDGSQALRDYFIDNALHWIAEYHVDGLRLDATHAIVDDSPRHFLAEFAARVRAGADRPVILVAEDHRNLDRIVRSPAEGGWGFDAVWADDFHHQVRRIVAGDDDGYFADFTDRVADVATTLRQGWFFTGQYAEFFGEQRGTDPRGLDPSAFVVCIQNHDQVGNRAFGDRLHTAVSAEAYRAASVLLLLAPESPLLFMGQEWAASTPFRYFTDHNESLGALVTEGRRREFAPFRAFASADARERIPDPQAPSTFESCRLDWDELQQPPHARILNLYRELLELRAEWNGAGWRGFDARALDDDVLALRWQSGPDILVIARLRGAGIVKVTGGAAFSDAVLTTEDPPFVDRPAPVAFAASGDDLELRFARPGAVVLRRAPSHGMDLDGPRRRP